MKKKILAIVCVVAVIFMLTACHGLTLTLKEEDSNILKENDPATLAAVPYTFAAEDGEWKASMEIRNIVEADLDDIENMDKKQINSDLLDDYRSVFHITYSGDKEFTYLKYTFANETQWKIVAISKKAENIKQGLTGDDLGGAFFSKDAVTGGALPPPTQTYTLDLIVKTADGEQIEKTFVLKPVSSATGIENQLNMEQAAPQTTE
jgi:hypothetical protein